MIENPRRQQDLVLEQRGEELHVCMPNDETQCLEGIDAVVLQAADGTNDMDTILRSVRERIDASLTRERVFAAFDRLGDLGLLESRVAPPANGSRTTRRDMMRLVGATAAMAVLAPHTPASAVPYWQTTEGEMKRKAYRAAEQKAKAEMVELRAAERDAKRVWRDAEDTVKTERRDVRQAERNVSVAERELRAAEEHAKREGTKEAEERVKGAEQNIQVAQRLAEQETKQFAKAEQRAGEAKKKAQESRVSEETAKKTNKSEAARARREFAMESEQARKAAEQASKGN